MPCRRALLAVLFVLVLVPPLLAGEEAEEEFRGVPVSEWVARLGELGERGREVLEALKKVGPEAVPVLRTALRSDDPAAGISAGLLLRELGPGARPALPELREVLADGGSDGMVRLLAASVLLGLDEETDRAGSALAEAVMSRDATIRDMAVSLGTDLGGRARAAAPSLWILARQNLPKVSDDAARALAACDPDGPWVERLRDALRDDSIDQRVHAIDTLANMGRVGARAVPDLLLLSVTRTGRDGVDARHALGVLGPDAASELGAALRHPHPKVRRAAAEHLAELAPKMKKGFPIAAVVEAVKAEQDPDLRDRVALLIARAGPADLPALRTLFGETNERLRVTVLRALHRMGRKAASEWGAVVVMLSDDSAWIRRLAAETLGAFGSSEPEVLEALGRAAKDPEPSVAEAAKLALSRLESGAGEELSGHLEMLGTRNEREAAKAVNELTKMGKDALPVLRKVLLEGTPLARDRAVRILGRLGRDARPAMPELVALLDNPTHHDAVFGTLDAIGNSAVYALIEALEEGEYGLRVGALRALAFLGRKAKFAISSLEKAARDTDPEIRRLAWWALQHVRGG